ncbi:DUF4238 domain-containing protein [Caulobacter endophyticus]|uniref:DUF4238 domain-containing protein n=1 Tax=Caulobacter endophyticus TaxID=2172652 RepID=A0A2T9KAI5_9CAUL|nr:DUF4238 domain-containing protein [Caulobacter endophyticus]PVM92982.1 hypothetical protein DDF67_04670 [Caulobacter endophyticus]
MPDTKSATQPRRHHYVPRFILKGFAVERKRGRFQTQVFDKHSGRTFAASINDVMVEGDFNALETPGGLLSIEAYISEIESKAAPLIERVVETGSLAQLSEADRLTLATFAALQFIRGTGPRAMAVAAAEAVNARIGATTSDAASDIRPDDGKRFGILSIATELAEYAGHFATKDLVLFRAPIEKQFILGDNPVTLENLEPSDFFGNLGLTCVGIQIGLPISNRFQLNFWCPTILAKARADRDEVMSRIRAINAMAMLSPNGLSDAGRALLEVLQKAMEAVTPLLEAYDSGMPIDLKEANVVRANSLQISYAERYIASAAGDFSLAVEMISTAPEYRRGRRMSVS